MGSIGENLKANLRKRRKALKMTQAEAAEAIDKAVRTYQSYEDGSVHPSTEVMDRLAALFKCKPIDLYADPGEPTKNQSLTKDDIRQTVREAIEELGHVQFSHEKASFDIVSAIEDLLKERVSERKLALILALVTEDPKYLASVGPDSRSHVQALLKAL